MINTENLLELAKLALVFYANAENYKATTVHEKGLIHSDMGMQAKYVLLQIAESNKDDNIENILKEEMLFNSEYRDLEGYMNLLNNIINGSEENDND